MLAFSSSYLSLHTLALCGFFLNIEELSLFEEISPLNIMRLDVVLLSHKNDTKMCLYDFYVLFTHGDTH